MGMRGPFVVSWGCTGKGVSSENGSGGWAIAELAGKALYRTIGGSTLVPVQVPAAVPIVSYESSVFGTGPSGERLPFASFKSSVFGSGRFPRSQLWKFLVDGDATDNLESLHSVRLTALLHDLVKKQGRLRAARTLGVNCKTVARSLKNARPSVQLREALMTRLLEQSEPDARESRPHPRRRPRALAMSEISTRLPQIQFQYSVLQGITFDDSLIHNEMLGHCRLEKAIDRCGAKNTTIERHGASRTAPWEGGPGLRARPRQAAWTTQDSRGSRRVPPHPVAIPRTGSDGARLALRRPEQGRRERQSD